MFQVVVSFFQKSGLVPFAITTCTIYRLEVLLDPKLLKLTVLLFFSLELYSHAKYNKIAFEIPSRVQKQLGVWQPSLTWSFPDMLELQTPKFPSTEADIWQQKRRYSAKTTVKSFLTYKTDAEFFEFWLGVTKSIATKVQTCLNTAY